MPDQAPFPSLIQLQFRRAKHSVCQRNVPVGQPPVEQPRPVEQNADKAKSFAQVAPSVGHEVVRQKPCGLKPGEQKPFRITTRFSQCEREILVRRSKEARLTVSEYIRASVLGPEYVSAIDPVKQELLKNISRELGRQGNNLNQIAKHLNAGTATPVQGDSLLAMLTRSLLAAHGAVRNALAEGRSEP